LILGYNSFLGYNTLQSSQLTPTPSTYTGLKVFGSCIIDNIHVVNYTMTDAEVDNIDYNKTPKWLVGKTLFLATFDDETLDGGNVKGLVNPITAWAILRRKIGETKYTQLNVLINPSAESYIDPTAMSRNTFEYGVVPIATDVLGTTMLSEQLSLDFDSWYLSSLDGVETYKMCANLNTTSLTSNSDIAQKQTVGQFDAFNRGNRQFESASMSFIPTFGYENNGITLSQTAEQIKTLREFIENGEVKILKNPKGEIWKVYTSNFSKTIINHGERTQLYAVDFDFAQVEEI
jgi:hypothetical protein